MDQSRDDQSAQAGKCRCAEKIDHGCCSDLAGSTRVSDGTDSNDNGTEDHGKDHHVQGVHVDTSDQTGHSEARKSPVRIPRISPVKIAPVICFRYQE